MFGNLHERDQQEMVDSILEHHLDQLQVVALVVQKTLVRSPLGSQSFNYFKSSYIYQIRHLKYSFYCIFDGAIVFRMCHLVVKGNFILAKLKFCNHFMAL